MEVFSSICLLPRTAPFLKAYGKSRKPYTEHPRPRSRSAAHTTHRPHECRALYHLPEADASTRRRPQVVNKQLSGKVNRNSNAPLMTDINAIKYENLMLLSSKIIIGKRTAERIVGSKARLQSLINEDKIRVEKPTSAQNSKWRIRLDECFRYARNARR